MTGLGRAVASPWLALASLLLVMLAWALALPLNGAPDEVEHVKRAAAVARGELVARPADVVNGTGGMVTAPHSFDALGTPANCFAFHSEVPASCEPPPPAPETPGPVVSGAARYFPLYYLLVGLPSLVFPNATGWYLMRVVSAAVAAALLAGAFASAGRLPGPLPRVGVLAAATPMALFLAGAVNPSSWEIAGAVGVWAAGAALLFGPAVEPTLVRRLAASGVLMITARGLAPLWLALIAAILLVAAPTAVSLARLRSRAVVTAAAVLALAGAAVAGWNAWQGTLEIGHNAMGQYGLGHRLLVPLQLLDARVQQMVGVFGWLDTPAPPLVYMTWAAILGTLVLLALAAGRSRLRWALLATAAATIAVPGLIEAATANRFGFVWQGRYSLPLAVGIPVLAGVAVALDSRLDRRAGAALAAWAAGLLAIGHMTAFAAVLIRYQSGTDHPLNLLGGPWHPPAGSLPVLALAAAGLLGLAVHVAWPRAEVEGG